MLRSTLARLAAQIWIASALVAWQGSPLEPRLHLPALALAAQLPVGPRSHLPLEPAAAALWHVPGDFASVQAAIDSAAPGDRIVVHGGTHPSTTIDRPLTLIGDPPPLFVNGGASSGPLALAPLRLAGPGSGRVVLCDVRVGGTVDGFLFSFTEAGIDGGGFDELQLFSCDVSGPTWVLLTGIAEGAPGLDLGVDALLVCDSTVAGSNSANDGCYGSGPAGPPGIRAPGATAIVLDSTVQGGGSFFICQGGSCPGGGGAGGAGIECATLLHADSAIVGGTGAEYYEMLAFGGLVLCGQAPDGPALVAAHAQALASDLHAVGPAPRAGGTWTLAWDPGASAALLIARERALAPIELQLLGWFFLDLGDGPYWLCGLPAAGSQALYLPPSQDQVGLTLCAQLLDLRAGLGRPVLGCVRP